MILCTILLSAFFVRKGGHITLLSQPSSTMPCNDILPRQPTNLFQFAHALCPEPAVSFYNNPKARSILVRLDVNTGLSKKFSSSNRRGLFSRLGYVKMRWMCRVVVGQSSALNGFQVHCFVELPFIWRRDSTILVSYFGGTFVGMAFPCRRICMSLFENKKC